MRLVRLSGAWPPRREQFEEVHDSNVAVAVEVGRAARIGAPDGKEVQEVRHAHDVVC